MKNPIQQDPLLCQSLHEVRTVDKEHFQRWRASFLKRYEAFLEETGTAVAKAKYKDYSRNVKKLMHLILKVKHYIDHRDLIEERTSVKARQTLSELSKQITIVIDQQDALLPMTGQMEQEIGYTKYHTGAVLLSDNFSEYRRLKMCAEILSSKFKVSLQNVASRQIMEELDRFAVKFQTFCDVIADLGLRDTLIKCNELAPLFEAEKKKKMQEKRARLEAVDKDKETSNKPSPTDGHGSMNSSFGTSVDSFSDYSSTSSDDDSESEEGMAQIGQYSSPSTRKHRKIENFSFFELDPTYEVDSDSEESATERTVDEEVLQAKLVKKLSTTVKETAILDKSAKDELCKETSESELSSSMRDQSASGTKQPDNPLLARPESLQQAPIPLPNEESQFETHQSIDQTEPQVVSYKPPTCLANDDSSSDDDDDDDEFNQAAIPSDMHTGTTRKPRKIENFSFFELDPTYEVDSDSEESLTERTTADEDQIMQVQPARRPKKRRSVTSKKPVDEKCNQDETAANKRCESRSIHNDGDSSGTSVSVLPKLKKERTNKSSPPMHNLDSLRGNSVHGEPKQKQAEEESHTKKPPMQISMRPDSLRGNSVHGDPNQPQENGVQNNAKSQVKKAPTHSSLRPDSLRGNSVHDEPKQKQAEEESHAKTLPTQASMRPDLLHGNSVYGQPKKKQEDGVEEKAESQAKKAPMHPSLRPDSLRGNSVHGEPKQKQAEEESHTKTPPTQPCMRPDLLRENSVHGDSNQPQEDGAQNKAKSQAKKAPMHPSLRPDSLRGNSVHGEPKQKQAEEESHTKKPPMQIFMRPDSLRGNSVHGDSNQPQEDGAQNKPKSQAKKAPMHPSLRPDSLRGNSVHGEPKQKQAEEESHTKKPPMQISMRPDSLRGNSVHGDPNQPRENGVQNNAKSQVKKAPTHSSLRPDSLRGNSVHGEPKQKQAEEESHAKTLPTQASMRPDLLHGNSVYGEPKQKEEDGAEEKAESQAKKAPMHPSLRPDSLRGNSVHGEPKQKQAEEESHTKKPPMQISMRPDSLRGNSVHGDPNQPQENGVQNNAKSQVKKAPTHSSLRPDSLCGNSVHGEPKQKQAEEESHAKTLPTQASMRPDLLHGNSVYGEPKQKEEDGAEEKAESQAKKAPMHPSLRPDSLRGNSVHGEPKQKQAEEESHTKKPPMQISMSPDSLRGKSVYGEPNRKEKPERSQAQMQAVSPLMRPSSIRSNFVHCNPKQTNSPDSAKQNSAGNSPTNVASTLARWEKTKTPLNDDKSGISRRIVSIKKNVSTVAQNVEPDGQPANEKERASPIKAQQNNVGKLKQPLIDTPNAKAQEGHKSEEVLSKNKKPAPEHTQNEKKSDSNQNLSPQSCAKRKPESQRALNIPHRNNSTQHHLREHVKDSKLEEKEILRKTGDDASKPTLSIMDKKTERKPQVSQMRQDSLGGTSIYTDVKGFPSEYNEEPPSANTTEKNEKLSQSNSHMKKDDFKFNKGSGSISGDEGSSKAILRAEPTNVAVSSKTGNAKKPAKGLPMESSTLAGASSETPKKKRPNTDTTETAAKEPPKMATLEPIKAPSASISDKEDNPESKPLTKEKARKCYMWYARMAMPNKEQMKKRVAALPKGCDITVEDVDMLPWVGGGAMLSVTKMNKLFLED